MALFASHLAKVAVHRATGNVVAAHIAKESIRQTSRRARREVIKHGLHNKTTQSPKSAHGFNPRPARASSAVTTSRTSSKGAAMRSMREPSSSRAGFGTSFGHGGWGGGHGGGMGGGMGAGGGWGGK